MAAKARPDHQLKVYIVGGNILITKMFYEFGSLFVGTRDIGAADIVVFTGGPDVDPKLYNERRLPGTYINESRDTKDLEAWLQCREDQFKVGICRGAQFLNVCNEGKLWQDIDEHTRPHMMEDIVTGRKIWVSSTHHQQMIPGPLCTMIAKAHEAGVKQSETREWRKTSKKGQLILPGTGKIIYDPDAIDHEVLWYEKTRSFCFQPHPELPGFGVCRSYFFGTMMQHYHDSNPKKAA